MKYTRLLMFSLTWLGLPTCHAQPWSGILAPSRAVDWSTAGVQGGDPYASEVQCGATFAAGTSASTINQALAGTLTGYTTCTSPGVRYYIKLGAGSFTGGYKWTRSNIGIRGSGANQTTVSGGSVTCSNGGNYFNSPIAVCSPDMGNADSGYSPATVYNWTGGYAQGTTTLSLNATAAIVTNQSLIFLDQFNDTSDTGNYFVSGDHPFISASEDPSRWYRNGGTAATSRSQEQVVVAANKTSNTITIPSPGLHSPNWASGKSPQAWIIQPIINASVEDMTVDCHSSGSDAIQLWGTLNVYVSGVKMYVSSSKHGIFMLMSAHPTIQSNYMFGSANGATDQYGIDLINTSDGLVANNIFHQSHSPIVCDGPCEGNVIAYNFAINDDPSSGWWSFWHHNAGDSYNLYEGNVAAGMANDDIHGTHNMITQFRNYYKGVNDVATSSTSNVNPYFDGAYTRFSNVIGNVLGTSSWNTGYSIADNQFQYIYVTGWGNGISNDSISKSSLFRWGNWDVVTNAIRWCGNSSNTGWSTTCSSISEVPTGLSLYGNPVPPDQTLPASFFLTTKPGWWPSGKAWPPIGPDVTGGNVTGTGGHANTIPAQDCYLNVMGGNPTGSGSALPFDASQCYAASSGAGGGTVNPPTNVTLVLH